MLGEAAFVGSFLQNHVFLPLQILLDFLQIERTLAHKFMTQHVQLKLVCESMIFSLSISIATVFKLNEHPYARLLAF